MDVNAIDQLRIMHPDTSFIFIYHTTKEGNFKGVNEHAHEVDVIVQVDEGKATSTGRFNAVGSMEIYLINVSIPFSMFETSGHKIKLLIIHTLSTNGAYSNFYTGFIS